MRKHNVEAVKTLETLDQKKSAVKRLVFTTSLAMQVQSRSPTHTMEDESTAKMFKGSSN